MSNLWFFRLKKAEQQRRRSSGEQSVGSQHSVQSAACLSASSLPAAACAQFGLHASRDNNAHECDHCGRANDHDDNDNEWPDERLTESHQCEARPDAPRANRANENSRSHATSSSRGGLLGDKARLWRPRCGAHPAGERGKLPGQTGPEVAAVVSQQDVAVERASGQEPAELTSGQLAGGAAEMGRRTPHVVPLVNIIRSDSALSGLCGANNFDAQVTGSEDHISLSGQEVELDNHGDNEEREEEVKEGEGGGEEDGEEDRGARSERRKRRARRAEQNDKNENGLREREWCENRKQLVCELASAAGERIESRLVDGGQLDGSGAGVGPDGARLVIVRADSGGSQFESVVCAPQQQQQQQARPGPGHRLLLSSGKVPPIHERLLDPNQTRAGAGPTMADSMDNLAALIPRVRVEFYNSENTLKEKLQLYFIKDRTVSLYVRTAKLILKVLACWLYVSRVILDRGPAYANCYGCQPFNAAQANNVTSSGAEQNSQPFVSAASQASTPTPTVAHQQPQANNYYSSGIQQQSLGGKFDSHPYDGPINFRALLWVDRGPSIWSLQTTIAVICFVEAILMQYLTYKNSLFSIISFHFTLELITNTPFILSIFWPELRTLFVPGFLNCWLAKQCLEAMLNDISIVRQSSVFSHRLTILSATVFCLIFTSACGFQHTQRSGGRNFISIFESIYFVVVTFSTVGYGDFKPETWPSQLFIMVMICVALIVLPTQFEQLAYFWIERKKLGASYAHHSTRHEKHVVVCSTTLRADTIMDFLNEFYAHPLLQTFSVVLLSPCELDTTMKLVLQTPTWNNRVVYIQGSALKATDLIRARMQSAEACFILAARNYNDRSAADEHTILRSWAIRDFSPYVPQYVQIFRTENKIHVAFAEHVVCDDEFKYALLANNCLIPGTSTLVTLLLHTSSQQARRRRRRKNRCHNWLGRLTGPGARFWTSPRRTGDDSAMDKLQQQQQQQQSQQRTDSSAAEPLDERDGDEDENAPEWKRLYGKCSANEIYHIRLSDSRFFGEYQGKSFTYASFHSHRKFGVALIGVQTDMRGTWPIMLNPGPSYVLKSSDILFYINITKEENSTLMPMIHQTLVQQQMGLAGQGHGPGGGGSEEPPASEISGSALASSPSATYIRVETSSPTVVPSEPEPPPPPPQQEFRPEYHAHQPPVSFKKHSVADGASIVARSLCSIAGVPAGTATELVGAARCGRGGDDERPLELHHLTAKLLAKRNSSASTGIPVGAQLSAGRESKSGAATAGLGSRNASTLELATLAAGNLRKGSNMSITSTRSRDASPTRLKQVVSGLAVKMKRVKLGKSLTHLTIPRMDLGGGSSASSTESFVNARGRRPSIAPVPAMMGESEEHDSDHEREQESYFAMSWHSSTESSPIVKKFVFCTTYVGVSPTLCYLLQRKKSPCCLQLIQACEHCPFKNARQYNWPNRCVILASDFASNGIYNFLVPLRAHFHNPNELRPIVLLLERKPTPQFIDAISWFPMVYWMPGSIDVLDDLIKAGINLAHSVVVTNKESTNSAEEDYLADCNTIVAVQTMFKMFPSAGIITELSQSSNMRFMQFRAHDLLLGGLTMAQGGTGAHHSRLHSQSSSAGVLEVGGASQAAAESGSIAGAGAAGNIIRDRMQLRKLHSQYYNRTMGKEANSHAYKFRLPFAAGNVFSASMLDTLLYQAFVKDYMITMVRLLLGIDQAPGSGFLSHMRITKEDLWIRTYGRLYQRLCSTTCEIPLGIYRTEPLETHVGRLHLAPEVGSTSPFSFGAFASQQASYEQATEELERIEISNMVKNRLQDLGMNVSDYDDSSASRNNTFSYVIINPNCDVMLREGDIIYLIRPSPIHSRKLFMHRANSVRHVDSSGGRYGGPGPAHQTPQSARSDYVAGNHDSITSGVGQSRGYNRSKGAPNLVSLSGEQTPGNHDHQYMDDPSSGHSLSKDFKGTFNSRSASKPSACDSLANKIVTSNRDNGQRQSRMTSSGDGGGGGTPQVQGQLRSYFSDGDFSEVLIKVDEHDDNLVTSSCHPNNGAKENQPLQTKRLDNDHQGSTMEQIVDDNSKVQRRRSSCSDAEGSDSKRSSVT